MSATPILEEYSGGASGSLRAGFTNLDDDRNLAHMEVDVRESSPRRLSIYPASAGFDLAEELDYLSCRTVEPNIFFNPRFLAPAMPRLEDREVRLAVIRDNRKGHNDRLRLLVPYSQESSTIGPSFLRVWTSRFGPLGTPLIDHDDPCGVISDFLAILGRSHLNLPSVLVLPDMKIDGITAGLIRSTATGLNLSIQTANIYERSSLKSGENGEHYLRKSLGSDNFETLHQARIELGSHGKLKYGVSRSSDDVRRSLEDFLLLEAAGSRGRSRAALTSDRLRAAFVREAVHRLSEQDQCRIHRLDIDGRLVAGLIVFVEAGIAYRWRATHDERLSALSPATHLLMDATRQHLDDPNVMETDSCALPGHCELERMWLERCRLGTFIIGLTPKADQAARHVASQLELASKTRNFAKSAWNRIKKPR